jgi:hypothetical protein
MYVDILSGAQVGWVSDLSEDALLHYVLSCRALLSSHDPGAGGSAHASLAAAIAYDRALMNLAAARGIDASPRNFCNPPMERRRLETALAEGGIDLEGLARTEKPGLEPGTPIPPS